MHYSLGILWFLLVKGLDGNPLGHRIFSYQRGKCENSIFNLLEDILKTELRVLINPNIRYSNVKYLKYDLYTALNPNQRQRLRTNDVIALKTSYFNPKWPVRFSIHGWSGKGTSCSNAAIKDAYLARGLFNVIIVDWSIHAMDISYGRVSRQLNDIAASFAKFVRFLNASTGVPFESMYLIGHSAGSHIAGLTGKLLKPLLLGAIFALDPAGLSHLSQSAAKRLAPGDALYVESIHSDITLLGNPNTKLSHASFFANWGLGQPQCPNATAAEFDFSCDHFAALYYFAESIRNPLMFGALRCDSIQSIHLASCRCSQFYKTPNSCAADEYMGGEPAVPKSGIYYFSTKLEPPFGSSDSLVNVRPPINSTILKSKVLPLSFPKLTRQL